MKTFKIILLVLSILIIISLYYPSFFTSLRQNLNFNPNMYLKQLADTPGCPFKDEIYVQSQKDPNAYVSDKVNSMLRHASNGKWYCCMKSIEGDRNCGERFFNKDKSKTMFGRGAFNAFNPLNNTEVQLLREKPMQ